MSGVIIELGPQGHTEVRWDVADPATVEQAKELFRKYQQRDWPIMKVVRGPDPATSQRTPGVRASGEPPAIVERTERAEKFEPDAEKSDRSHVVL